MIQEWMLEATPTDLPEPYASFAKQVGVKAALELAILYGGMTIYLPKLETSMRDLRDRTIKKEFTGYNAKELSKKYDITESWLRRVVGDYNPDQLSLFQDAGYRRG